MVWVLDLDGVVWLADEAVPGSATAIAALREAGTRVLFATNNSSARVDDYVDKLWRMGIPADPTDLVSSAQAGAALVTRGERVLVCAGPGVHEALAEQGVDVLDAGAAESGHGTFDAVVVGWHRTFDFARLHAAADAVRRGARLIGTNDDATYPTPSGVLPGGGAILAAVAYAADATPVIAGKPHEPMAALVRARCGDEAIDVVVGDRPSTDGLLATRLGAPFGLVLTGVTPGVDAVADPKPDYVAADLGELAALLS